MYGDEKRMKMNFSVDNNQIAVALVDSMYVEEAGEFRETILKHISAGYKNYIIDLSGLQYIDSAGMGVLVALHKRVLQEEGILQLKGLQGSVKKIFELTRLTQVFDIIE